MGGHGHGPAYVVPKYTEYQSYKGIKQLELLEKKLAEKGLKDPWIRNEIWRYHKGWGTKTSRGFLFFFRGLPLGVALAAGLAFGPKLLGGDKGHGHEGHGAH